MLAAGRRSLSGWPAQGAPAKDVGMRVEHGLARTRAGVEHQAVPAVGHTFGDRYLMRLGHHLGEQPVRGFGQRRHIRIVRFRYDQNMDGRLRIDITKRNRAMTLKHALSR